VVGSSEQKFLLDLPEEGFLVAQHSLFDELDTQANGASAPTKRRASVPGASERAAWEAWKTRLLPGFVAPYCQASRLHRSCWWVDGLAAASRGQRGEMEGAAFAATADALAAAGFTLRGARLEASKSSDKAPETTRANGAEPSIEEPIGAQRNGRRTSGALQALSSESLMPLPRDALLTALDMGPTILLLNPFAAPPLTAEELIPLCQRQAPTELLLTISTAQLEHLATQDLAEPPIPEAGRQDRPDPPPTLTALLRSDTWKTVWTAPGKSAEKARRTLELLRGMLKAHFLYVCVATLDDLPSAAPRRLLLFASRQYPSVALLNDFLCAEQVRLARERETQALQGSWFARRRETARAAARAALKEELHALGRLRRARLWPDLKPLLVLDHFGQFSTTDHDAVLLELLREGRIACRWSPATPPAEAEAAKDAPPVERIPGPQDFLDFLEARPRPAWRR
jgi:hypothetical protein